MVPREGSVLDVGCWGFQQMKIANHLGLTGLKHFGVDWGKPEGVPAGMVYKQADLDKESIPFPDDSFDFVIASHVIEHLGDQIAFFGECVRVCKPGGLLYFEAPSERSLWLPGNPFNHDDFYTVSFWDDPTHSRRPWTPQAFHRLTLYFSCQPIKTGHLFSWIHRILFPGTLLVCLLTRNKLLETCVWQAVGWAAYLIARKPASVSGKPAFRYYIPKRAYKIASPPAKNVPSP
jgi:SAM-dependent methyltransferase